jgi:hypothetical protein
VLATRDGLRNVAYDRGIVESVAGQELTLTTMANVAAGMKAVVVELPGRTVVFAHAPRS